jgi:Transposase DDE domain group 1
MAWCENNSVDFLFGLAKNARLSAEIETELAAAQEQSQHTGKPGRRFRDFTWQTRKSWSRERRVVAKAEWTEGRANPRFVVTSLAREAHEARHLYEKLYCARGEMENRIKSLPSRKRGNASSISMPTAPLPTRCAPTSCGCGSPQWPTS